jgi:hypothetical protein
MKEAG